MAISYVGGRGAGTAGQGGGSIAINTGLTGGSGGAPITGDLVVVTVCVGSAARTPAINIVTPTGYTPLTVQRTTTTTYDTNVQTCYKVMGATPDTAVTIPASGNAADGIAYTIQVFRGVNTTTPMDTTPTYATGTAVNNLPNPAAITPVTAGAWIVACGGGSAGTGGTYVAGYLTNFLTFNGPDTNDASIGSGYYTGWTSGAYDPAAYTGGSANAANSWGSTTLALRPAPLVYTLDAGSTSFTLTGQDATLSYVRRLSIDAAAGSFALTGQDVTFFKTSAITHYEIEASPASFDLAGQDASLAYVRRLSLDAGSTSYAITGQAASFGVSRNIHAESAAFALTGQAASVLYGQGHPLDASAGSYTITGQDASLTHSRRLSLDAAAGSYALTGADATLSFAGSYAADPGAFIITGQDAALLRTYSLDAGVGAFDLIGQDAGGATPAGTGRSGWYRLMLIKLQQASLDAARLKEKEAAKAEKQVPQFSKVLIDKDGGATVVSPSRKVRKSLSKLRKASRKVTPPRRYTPVAPHPTARDYAFIATRIDILYQRRYPTAIEYGKVSEYMNAAVASDKRSQQQRTRRAAAFLLLAS